MRVVEGLNRALHCLLARDQNLVVLGQDIADPYGGAFGVTRGLSTSFPDRVISTPISEAGVAGMAGGLAMCGDRVLVEIMFGDFITLCFDPIVNFISKSVSMYGRRLEMPVVVRCPVGGNRGYGPTHSQNLAKHFVGIPHLNLYELSQFHDPLAVLSEAFATGEPAIFFEDKVLYGQPSYLDGTAEDLFAVQGSPGWTRAGIDLGEPADCVILAPGGLGPRALAAIRTAAIEDELRCELLVPSRLFPLDLEPVLPVMAAAGRIVVAEDGVAGGGWGAEAAHQLNERLWGELRQPVRLVQPRCETIPAARHLERDLLVQDTDIYAAVQQVMCTS